MEKKILKKIPQKAVKIFKIANRKGYGALCINNLTEGLTPALAYMRMLKAVKRSGFELPEITSEQVKKCVVSEI
ncbi:MAG: hypothetical protein KKD05_00660 [Candidatus Omnitrophica bacterium]|nr:hypothetical protein [Candidatus Omnitrophota bacterium]